MVVKKDKLFANRAERISRNRFTTWSFFQKLNKGKAYRATEDSYVEKALYEEGLRYDTKAESTALNTVLGNLDEDTNTNSSVQTIQNPRNAPDGAIVKMNGKVGQISDKRFQDLEFSIGSVSGNPKKPFWSPFELHKVFFERGGSVKNDKRIRIIYPKETSANFANMKYVRENLDSLRKDYTDKTNEIITDDDASIHYYNESFLTTKEEGKGNFVFENSNAKRLIFLNTTNQPLLYIRKDISSLFPDGANIQFREKTKKYSNQKLSPSQISRGHFFFEKYLEIRKLNSGTYMIEPLVMQPASKDGYLDTQNKKLYLNCVPEDFPNLNLQKLNDQTCALTFTNGEANQAFNVLTQCTNVHPLVYGIHTYYFVVTQAGELTVVQLTKVIGEIKVLGRVRIDASINPQIVFPVKNYGQFNDPNESLISFYTSDKLYMIKIVRNKLTIREATNYEEQFKSVYSVQTDDNTALFLNIRFRNAGHINPQIGNIQSIGTSYGNQYNISLGELYNGEIRISISDTSVIEYEIRSKKLNINSWKETIFSLKGGTFATAVFNSSFTTAINYSQINDSVGSLFVSYESEFKTFTIFFNCSNICGFKVFIVNAKTLRPMRNSSFYMGNITSNDTSNSWWPFLQGHQVKFSNNSSYPVALYVFYGAASQTNTVSYSENEEYNFGSLKIIRNHYVDNSNYTFLFPPSPGQKPQIDTIHVSTVPYNTSYQSTACLCSMTRQYNGISVSEYGGFA